MKKMSDERAKELKAELARLADWWAINPKTGEKFEGTPAQIMEAYRGKQGR